MKNNINNLIISIKKMEYLRFIQEKNEEMYEITDDYIEEFYFEDWLRLIREDPVENDEVNCLDNLIIDFANEIDCLIEEEEEKLKYIVEYMIKHNLDNFNSYFKNYASEEILTAIYVLIDLKIDIYNGRDLIIKLNKVLEEESDGEIYL